MNRSSTGIGSSYNFYPDGRFEFIAGAMIDYIYHLDGSRLITTRVNVFTRAVKKDTSFIVIKNDSLYQRKDGEIIKTYARVKKGNNDPSGITGTWRSDNKAGQTGYYNFTGDGTLYFRLPFKTIEGSFTSTGDKINFSYRGSLRTDTFRIKDGFLTITSGDGSEQTYHRTK